MTGQSPAETVVAPTGTTTTTTADNVNPAPGVTVGNPSPGSGLTTSTPAFDTTAWLAGLDNESRELATKKEWKSPADLTKSYVELEKAFSTRTPSEKKTYAAEDYKFTIPDNAKDINYDEGFANGFKDHMVKAGADPALAAGIHDFYTQFATDAFKKANENYVEEVKTKVSSTEADLVREWGDKSNPVFKRNTDLAYRAMSQLGIVDDLVSAGVLIDNNGVKTAADAKLIKAFAKIGAGMYAEDEMFGSSVVDGRNPFDPKTADSDVQGKLIKNDPEKALLLIGALPPEAQAMWQPVLNSIRARVKK